MATSTFRPTGAGFYTDWTPSAGSNWQNVDETVSDGDTTKNTVVGAIKYDTFVSSDSISTAGTVSKMTVYVTMKSSASFSQLPQLIVISSGASQSLYPTGVPFLTTSYVEYSYDFTTDPNTGSAWTAAAVNAAEFGYTEITGAGTPTASATQCYAIITYELPCEGTVAATLPNLTTTGAAKHTLTATSACTLPKITCLATHNIFIATASLTLPNLTASTSGTAAVPTPTGTRTGSTRRLGRPGRRI